MNSGLFRGMTPSISGRRLFEQCQLPYRDRLEAHGGPFFFIHHQDVLPLRAPLINEGFGVPFAVDGKDVVQYQPPNQLARCGRLNCARGRLRRARDGGAGDHPSAAAMSGMTNSVRDFGQYRNKPDKSEMKPASFRYSVEMKPASFRYIGFSVEIQPASFR